MKVLVFDIWGDYGHFRKYFTTSSPLTFAFPPKIAVYGIVSAILGIDKNDYLRYFQDKTCKVAIRLLNPVKKSRIAINYINTKSAIDMSKIKERTQVNLEVIKDCRFRIYLNHKDEKIYNGLKKYLMDKKSVYSISLGLSEFLANYKFVGEFEAEKIENKKFVEINTVIPFNENIDIKFQHGREYLKDTVYNEMNEKREVTEYISVLYERKGQTIICNVAEYYKLESGENIVFI